MPNPIIGWLGGGAGPTWQTPGQHQDTFGVNPQQGFNPRVNMLAVPVGQVFRQGQNLGGAQGDHGNVTNTLQRMSNQMPANAQRAQGKPGAMPGLNLGANHQAAMNKNINQLGRSNYLTHRLSLMRAPVTTAGPQLQLTGQIGAAEQLRDAEQLSNTYLSNAYAGQNSQLSNIMALLQFMR